MTGICTSMSTASKASRSSAATASAHCQPRRPRGPSCSNRFTASLLVDHVVLGHEDMKRVRGPRVEAPFPVAEHSRARLTQDWVREHSSSEHGGSSAIAQARRTGLIRYASAPELTATLDVTCVAARGEHTDRGCLSSSLDVLEKLESHLFPACECLSEPTEYPAPRSPES